jgi:hypothetical protein
MNEMTSASHYSILVQVLSILEPWGRYWSDRNMHIKEYHRWVIIINNISTHIEALLDLITGIYL